MDFQYEQEYVIHKLHKSESLNQISISYDTNQRKQIAFCPYCGVMNKNTATALSHARKHLRIVFLCGGCYNKIYKKPQFLYNHMLSCQLTVIHQKDKDSQKSEGESQMRLTFSLLTRTSPSLLKTVRSINRGDFPISCNTEA